MGALEWRSQTKQVFVEVQTDGQRGFGMFVVTKGILDVQTVSSTKVEEGFAPFFMVLETTVVQQICVFKLNPPENVKTNGKRPMIIQKAVGVRTVGRKHLER